MRKLQQIVIRQATSGQLRDQVIVDCVVEPNLAVFRDLRIASGCLLQTTCMLEGCSGTYKTVLGLDRTDISCTVAHKWDADFFLAILE